MTRLAFKRDLATTRIVKSIDTIQHGAFSGAIGANNRSYLPLLHLKTDVIKCSHTTE
jgi:hypothetical protein